ncbi:MAG TPA: DUF1203 domain-containing protein [Caulobacteraceae bacterium]|jgi:hypothetical protein|nr:DUF1203 domain-containing protein [Caulobacteraceae bacterium]
MSFRITGLDPGAFAPLFALSDEALAAEPARWVPVDSERSAPCRITLEDARPGERVLLLNYEHQPAPTPFRASHAIFVREGAHQRYDRVDEVPPALRVRALSVRGFDKDHMMIDAALVDGADLEAALETMFAKPAVDYVQLHYALRGCYAARAERA